MVIHTDNEVVSRCRGRSEDNPDALVAAGDRMIVAGVTEIYQEAEAGNARRIITEAAQLPDDDQGETRIPRIRFTRLLR